MSSAGIVEDLNKLRVTLRRTYGLKYLKAIQIALYRALGTVREPEFTHRYFGRGDYLRSSYCDGPSSITQG